MPSRYFQELTDPRSKEWKELNSIIEEVIFNFGEDVFYIPKDITTFEDIFGEDAGRNVIAKSVQIRMGLLSYESFQDAGVLFGSFGIEVSDKIKLVTTQDGFKKITGYDDGLKRIGDIIYIPKLRNSGKMFWEVKGVDPTNDNQELMRFGDEHIYVFKCEMLKLDATDKFVTPIEEINSINDFIDNINKSEDDAIDEKIDNVWDFDDEDPFNENR